MGLKKEAIMHRQRRASSLEGDVLFLSFPGDLTMAFGEPDPYMCPHVPIDTDCGNSNCPMGQYRSGSCSDTSNGYQCNSMMGLFGVGSGATCPLGC